LCEIFNGKEILEGCTLGVLGIERRATTESPLPTSAITNRLIDWELLAREVGISRKVWGWGLQKDLVAPLKNNNNRQDQYNSYCLDSKFIGSIFFRVFLFKSQASIESLFL
jgi:hypothetical protein